MYNLTFNSFRFLHFCDLSENDDKKIFGKKPGQKEYEQIRF